MNLLLFTSNFFSVLVVNSGVALPPMQISCHFPQARNKTRSFGYSYLRTLKVDFLRVTTRIMQKVVHFKGENMIKPND